MAPTITPLNASFGAVVTDVRIADLSDADWQAIESAFHEYAALVFPAQHLTTDEHVAFGERFGEIEVLRPGQKHAAISNKAADGHILTEQEKTLSDITRQ